MPALRDSPCGYGGETCSQAEARRIAINIAKLAELLNGGSTKLAPVGILCIPPNITWRFVQAFVMAACSSHELYQLLKIRIDLPKFAQHERIAGT